MALEHTPPPFFKRGPAPLALLIFYTACALALFVVDLRFHTLDWLRQGISVLTDPVQRLAQAPINSVSQLGSYFANLETLQGENTRLRHSQLLAAPSQLHMQELESENLRLRKLLELNAREKTSGLVAQILYTARDPFNGRVVIDKGMQASVAASQPVIDEQGLIGQVTRVFPLSAEITLITDRNQAVPVQIVRNGLRSVVFGVGNGQLELKYMPSNADVQNGDLLVTSGLDGVYRPGLPVAKVVQIERDSAYSFARIFCVPVAGVRNYSEVMVLAPRAPLPVEKPEETTSGNIEDAATGKPVSGKKKTFTLKKD